METALAQDDWPAWADADGRFHTELVRLGGNSRVVAIVALMAGQARRAKAVNLYMHDPPLKSNQDRRQVVDAIAQGDRDRAQRIHRTHRMDAKATLIQILAQNRLHML